MFDILEFQLDVNSAPNSKFHSRCGRD